MGKSNRIFHNYQYFTYYFKAGIFNLVSNGPWIDFRGSVNLDGEKITTLFY